MSAARRVVKRMFDACSLAVVAPLAATCGIERWRGSSETVFTLWAQALALVPGQPGVFLRRAYYRMTIESCGRHFFIGFGAVISHRRAVIEDDVYVGPYALIGSSRLRRGCLIGSRSSLLSGGSLHSLDADSRWMPSDMSRLRTIEIGEYAWIGEASVIVADIGRSAMVVAGSVVASPVPGGTVVAGNPARFVRRLPGFIPNEEERPVNPAIRVS